MGLSTKNRFLLFWAFLAGIAVLTVSFLPWRFQLNDDMIMMWLVRGDYSGQPESYAVFIHPILSWTFAELYTLIPGINWYPLTWFLVMYSSFLVFVNGIHTHLPKYLSTFLSLLLLAFLIHFLFFLQFSIVAAFAIAAGLSARGFHYVKSSQATDKRNPRFSSIYATDSLILIGALIRIEVLFLFLAGLSVLTVVVYRNRLVIRVLGFPFLLLIVLSGYQLVYIYSNGLQEFNRINRLRSAVFDDPVLQLGKERFRDADPGFYHFANGLMDFNRETNLPEKMEVWKILLNESRFSNLSPTFILKALSYWIWHERYFTLLTTIVFGLTFYVQFKKSSLAALLLLGLMILLSPFFLLKIQVWFIIVFVYFSSFLISSNDQKDIPKSSILATCMLTVLLVYHIGSFFSSEKNLFPIDKVAQITSFDPNHENLYLIGMDELNYHLMAHKPTGLYYLGWPSLLVEEKRNRSIYRVSRRVYEENRGYFESFQIKNSTPEYFDLMNTK